jgi:hypothetical protein
MRMSQDGCGPWPYQRVRRARKLAVGQAKAAAVHGAGVCEVRR